MKYRLYTRCRVLLAQGAVLFVDTITGRCKTRVKLGGGLQNFQAVTSAPNGQVLRYCVEGGGAPLWGRASPQPNTIPPCNQCGAPRRFEFQVLPQMLAFLGIDDTQEDAPDW
jgi:hypothetical protein